MSRTKDREGRTVRTLLFESEITRLRAALSFYADKENWDGKEATGSWGTIEYKSDTEKDSGKIARDTLEGK